MVVKSRSVKKMRKTRWGWGETRPPFPSGARRFARFNTSPLYYLRAWHRLHRGERKTWLTSDEAKGTIRWTAYQAFPLELLREKLQGEGKKLFFCSTSSFRALTRAEMFGLKRKKKDVLTFSPCVARKFYIERERRLDTRQVLGGCTGVKKCSTSPKKAYGPIAYNSSQDWPWSVSQAFSLGIQVSKTFLSPLIQRVVSPIKKSNKFAFGTPWLPIIYFFRHQNEISVADAQMSFLAKRSFRQVAWRDCCYLKPTGNSGQKPCFSKSLKHLY